MNTIKTIKARTVKDLIEVLRTLAPSAGWYGYVDESLIITKNKQDILCIEPNNYEEGYL